MQFQIVSNTVRMHALETLFSFFLCSQNKQHDWTKKMLLNLGKT